VICSLKIAQFIKMSSSSSSSSSSSCLEILKCKRFAMTPFVDDEHMSGAIELFANKDVVEHLYFGPNTEAQTRAWIGAMSANERSDRLNDVPMDERSTYTWAMVSDSDGAFLGLFSVRRTAPRVWQGAYFVSPKRWAEGLCTEALEQVLRFAFNEAGARRIEAELFASNAASSRVLEKCAFVPEGVRRQRYVGRDGKPVDELMFALLLDDYRSQEAASDKT
jgi:RimJ/RimL family protein N-acetyltransferase